MSTPRTPACDKLSRTKDIMESWARGGLDPDNQDFLDAVFGINRDAIERERRELLTYVEAERESRK